ncbi:MAG: HoxN/HupN/NixA family nickel/cobalt transporter [Candidatus Micrarchaeota archaeon]|nr:HoxN/HupN/NixA family nickel/cobalt transporter [Candidatus Micrarchaeota archaeon]
MKLNIKSGDKTLLILLYGLIIAVTLASFAASAAIGKAYPLLAGLGIVAYVLGLRHAVDADHIAAIDGTTRKLLREGKRPLTVGTWFSLGHSTIVALMIFLVVLATRAASASIPELQSFGAIIGTAISGLFLWIIGIINIAIAIEIYNIFKRIRSKKIDDVELEKLLSKRGFMNRYLGHLFKIVREPWQIYPIGLLFGLGFDTASEVALIAIGVGVGISSAVPTWTILILPIMFACGMVLIDTTDGVAMSFAYGWAFLRPIRKIYYNLTISIISVAVAIMIGTIELLQVVSLEFKITGGFWGWINAISFETLGFGIIALFMASWAVALLIYRYKNLDDVGREVRKANH